MQTVTFGQPLRINERQHCAGLSLKRDEGATEEFQEPAKNDKPGQGSICQDQRKGLTFLFLLCKY